MKKHIFFCCMLVLMTSTVVILVAESTAGQALGFTALFIFNGGLCKKIVTARAKKL